MLPFKETSQGLFLPVQVVPRAGKSELAGIVNDALKIRLKSAPVDGKANEECLRYLADCFGIARNRLSIHAGATSRKKTIFISGIGATEMAAVLSALFPRKKTPDLFEYSGEKDPPPCKTPSKPT